MSRLISRYYGMILLHLHEFYLNSFMPLNLWRVNLWCKSEFLPFYILFDFLSEYKKERGKLHTETVWFFTLYEYLDTVFWKSVIKLLFLFCIVPSTSILITNSSKLAQLCKYTLCTWSTDAALLSPWNNSRCV